MHPIVPGFIKMTRQRDTAGKIQLSLSTIRKFYV